MASLLDLLKAKGIDPTALSSQMAGQAPVQALASTPAPQADEEQADDDLAKAKALEEAAQTDKDNANELAATGDAEAKDGEKGDAEDAAQDAALDKDDDVITPSPAPTGKGPMANPDSPNMMAADKLSPAPDTFAGFPGKYDTVNDPSVLAAADSRSPASVDDDSDDTDDTDTKAPISARSALASGNKDQLKALQMALNNGGFTNNTVEGLKAAQDEANRQKNIDNMMRAVAQITGGLSGMSFHNAKPVDTTQTQKLYDNMDAQADQGVKDFAARGEQEKNDPKSAASVQARAILGAASKSLGLTIPENMSAAQVEQFFPKIAAMQTASDNREARSADLAARLDSNRLVREEMAQKKASDKQNQMFNQTQQLLESARGNPAVAQAEKDRYASDKANSLTKLYGDTNKMSPEMVQLLASEVGKIASGGVPTMHELEGLTPQTLQSKFASNASKLTNNPTPANAAAFVKQYQDYANALSKDAESVISDKYGRILNSRRGMLSPEQTQALDDQYLGRFNKKALTTSNSKTLSPEDQQAVDWAKANPTDPRAQQILKLHE